MLERIKRLLREWLCKEQAAKLVPPTLPQPVVREFTTMRPTGTTVKLGNDEYPVFHYLGSPKLAHVLAGHVFVPLSILQGKR